MSDPLLKVRHLTKQYRHGVLANDDLSLDVRAGEVFGLLGPNGAGKTTLVSQVLGLLRPTSGEILLDGIDVARRPEAARSACSYQPQGSAPLEGMTPVEAVELTGRLRGGDRATVRRRTDDLLSALDLDAWRNRLVPLSGGVARLVSFCMAAVHPVRLAVLDEPTNDVDPLRRRLLWEQVRQLADTGTAVLLVTHNVAEAEKCVDRLAIIDHGKVQASGTPAVLKGRLGGALRLELTLDVGASVPLLPEYLAAPAVAGRRVVAQATLADAGRAVGWARDAQQAGSIAEFQLSPASLEDVYIRSVTAAEEDAHAALLA
ncbi:MAG: ABC-type multidrug transport system, ATPase component [Frankiales bacterium]|nr:ABC-type multidrug transport system, ATPase component [Frankiales bacterium]